MVSALACYEAAPDGGPLGAGRSMEYCDICGAEFYSEELRPCPHCDILLCAECGLQHSEDCCGPLYCDDKQGPEWDEVVSPP